MVKSMQNSYTYVNECKKNFNIKEEIKILINRLKRFILIPKTNCLIYLKIILNFVK